MDPRLLIDYATKYGTRISILLENCSTEDDLGPCFSPGLFEREVQYLMAHEYAKSAEAILWR